ncbi:hypothetical protein C8Q77DRAFT_233331 [Trametes polyzona]|nr:hypothetical protein C8Q77DRAFT_233331 [Trametes polyzona]
MRCNRFVTAMYSSVATASMAARTAELSLPTTCCRTQPSCAASLISHTPTSTSPRALTPARADVGGTCRNLERRPGKPSPAVPTAPPGRAPYSCSHPKVVWLRSFSSSPQGSTGLVHALRVHAEWRQHGDPRASRCSRCARYRLTGRTSLAALCHHLQPSPHNRRRIRLRGRISSILQYCLRCRHLPRFYQCLLKTSRLPRALLPLSSKALCMPLTWRVVSVEVVHDYNRCVLPQSHNFGANQVPCDRNYGKMC